MFQKVREYWSYAHASHANQWQVLGCSLGRYIIGSRILIIMQVRRLSSLVPRYRQFWFTVTPLLSGIATARRVSIFKVWDIIRHCHATSAWQDGINSGGASQPLPVFHLRGMIFPDCMHFNSPLTLPWRDRNTCLEKQRLLADLDKSEDWCSLHFAVVCVAHSNEAYPGAPCLFIDDLAGVERRRLGTVECDS